MANNRISDEQYAEYLRKGLVADAPPTASTETSKPSKYRNQKCEIDGFTFDSKKEANRYLDLREQQRAGHIFGLTRQQRYAIEVNGQHICDYIADFEYFRFVGSNGTITVEDCKSAATRKIPVYVLKKKLMKAVLGIDIIEV